jgi:hypothetical protein
VRGLIDVPLADQTDVIWIIGSTLAGFLNRYVHFCTDGQISQRFNVGISAP